jgi:formiminoglutamase
VNYLLDVDFDGERVQSLLGNFLARVDSLYLSVCLDVLPADRAPGVSAPAALGVAPALVISAIDQVGRLCREYGVQWLACDLAELSPPHDLEDRTARLGARLADELLWSRFGAGPGGSSRAD